jgi:hypothetical protein
MVTFWRRCLGGAHREQSRIPSDEFKRQHRRQRLATHPLGLDRSVAEEPAAAQIGSSSGAVTTTDAAKGRSLLPLANPPIADGRRSSEKK